MVDEHTPPPGKGTAGRWYRRMGRVGTANRAAATLLRQAEAMGRFWGDIPHRSLPRCPAWVAARGLIQDPPSRLMCPALTSNPQSSPFGSRLPAFHFLAFSRRPVFSHEMTNTRPAEEGPPQIRGGWWAARVAQGGRRQGFAASRSTRPALGGHGKWLRRILRTAADRKGGRKRGLPKVKKRAFLGAGTLW